MAYKLQKETTHKQILNSTSKSRRIVLPSETIFPETTIRQERKLTTRNTTLPLRAYLKGKEQAFLDSIQCTEDDELDINEDDYSDPEWIEQEDTMEELSEDEALMEEC